MQSLAQRIWSPASHTHIGDLAWQRRQHLGREEEWNTKLWTVDEEVVAWGWLDGAHLDLLVDPNRPEFADQVLEWAEEAREVVVLDAEKHLITASRRRGYRVQKDPHTSHYMALDLARLEEPVLPQGFRARPVGDGDLARRVEVHRRAWHPSRVTEDSYRTVMAAWPYERNLDWIVEAPDGRFAANCLIWLDHVNGVGEIEPVGTDPAFRGMGLAKAVCGKALRALRESGARQAVVYPVESNPAAMSLYRGLGFETHARTTTLVRTRPHG
jgi:ribosomal protein S18 acetylase RimI-like enzyme